MLAYIEAKQTQEN